MTPSNTNTNPPHSLAAGGVVPSIGFTFTTNVKPASIPSISAPAPTTTQLLHGQSIESRITAMKISEAPAISLRSAINAAAPANHLPTELVVKILTSGVWSDWWELVTLSHICRHWRNIALGTPQLWADAVHSAFAELYGWTFNDDCQFLPTLLERSMPCPLRADFKAVGVEDPDDEHLVFLSHFSRLTHLSIKNLTNYNFTTFVDIVGPYLRNLQSLQMPLVNTSIAFSGISNFIDINELWFWHDVDFPRLHALNISAHCFFRPISVASLRDVVLWDGARSYDDFLDALDRCADGLQSLTLNNWSEPWYSSRMPNSATRTIRLPNLRHFSVSLSSEAQSSNPLTFLFTFLSFPPDVAIYLDWKYYPVSTHELLPKDLVGLQAPPFFDSMYLHLYALPDTVTAALYCYVDDTERLTVREWPLVSRPHPIWGGRRRFNEFLDENQYATVTQLALDFDMKPQNGIEPFVSANLLQKYLGALPCLRRLDIFGKAIGNGHLDVVTTFLNLPEPGDAQGASGKTLGYVCKVEEHVKSANKAKHLGSVCAELDNLARVLKAHQAAGGAWLHRLELCVATCLRDSHNLSRWTYPYVHRFPPERELTACVALAYFQRFEALVEEVVFVGYVERRASGPGYRLLTDKGLQLVPARSKHSTGGLGRKGTTPGRPSSSPRKWQKN